ncbi:MAG: hypothetical protein U0Q11_13475 [Vicinamibacterales bacterium]
MGSLEETITVSGAAPVVDDQFDGRHDSSRARSSCCRPAAAIVVSLLAKAPGVRTLRDVAAATR